nr:MAG TPA: holin [Caudoviricetes sp.]
MNNTNNSLNDEILRNTPPIGVSTLTVLGVPLSDMVYVMTIIYILVQIFCTIYRTYKSTKESDV